MIRHYNNNNKHGNTGRGNGESPYPNVFLSIKTAADLLIDILHYISKCSGAASQATHPFSRPCYYVKTIVRRLDVHSLIKTSTVITRLKAISTFMMQILKSLFTLVLSLFC